MITTKYISSLVHFLKTKKKLLLKIFAISFAFWAAVIAMAPWLISKGFLEKQIQNQLSANVSIKKAKLSWLSGQEFEDVCLSDQEGDTLLTIKKVHTTASLISLLMHTNDYKDVTISDLTGNLVLQKEPTYTIENQSLLKLEKNKNRINPIWVLKKPFFGNFKVLNSIF